MQTKWVCTMVWLCERLTLPIINSTMQLQRTIDAPRQATRLICYTTSRCALLSAPLACTSPAHQTSRKADLRISLTSACPPLALSVCIFPLARFFLCSESKHCSPAAAEFLHLVWARGTVGRADGSCEETDALIQGIGAAPDSTLSHRGTQT